MANKPAKPLPPETAIKPSEAGCTDAKGGKNPAPSPTKGGEGITPAPKAPPAPPPPPKK